MTPTNRILVTSLSVATLFFALLGALPVTASPLVSADPLGSEIESDSPELLRTPLPPAQWSVDGKLKKNFDFWVRIYTEYYTYQGLIHDAKYIDRVYEVMDLRKSDTKSSRAIRQAKKKWHNLLLSVHHKQAHPETLSPEELKVFKMFEDLNEPNKYLNAAHRKRLRFQLGQKDRFLDGYKQSGGYLPTMERIFKEEGLPVELTRLPFVESSFNTRARSKVGASGIWQFMRSTGKLFLKINDAVDERNDPIRATEAAARLLRVNYESLKQWPLAVTAYNHGRIGMMKAVRKVGSDDLEDVVDGYRARTFGFASGNFFTELLAAIEVEKNAEKYFGKLERDQPVNYFEVVLPDFVPLAELVKYQKLDLAEIKKLNPGISDLVYRGKRLLPRGYKLRLSVVKSGEWTKEKLIEQQQIATQGFMQLYELIPDHLKQKSQRRHAISRRVISGSSD